MADRTATRATRTIVIIGLGRFGGQVADSMLRMGFDVLGVDSHAGVVQRWADRLTYVVQADSTDTEALRQLGLHDFQRVVVGIGSDIEASVLTVLSLTEIGVRDVWAKAVSGKHGKILRSVGAANVIFPEAAMGERVAHLITSKMLDFIEFDDGFSIAETRIPADAVGRRLAEAGIRSRYGVTVIGVKVPGERFTYARRETELPQGALLIVSGTTEQVQRFAANT
ncbi:TrkA family potassium uptake protein [Solwaraspora sp. WMMD406]|uniref:potassium channel family protein n=1 Tax=Solwaraspora sp. WMMD406 TaxID=3016095 RepID=UPI002417FAD2|nr:TrkA family potassium uptake protein [Solwaraspora sp. WMMD406]MDG4763588.1 TrkA family potassium uptake protein [Solwaraspora sp. WMMD406]